MNEKLETLSFIWEDRHDDSGREPPMPKLLCKPSAKDVPLPCDDFYVFPSRPYSAAQCDTYSLTSSKSKQRMEVFLWCAEDDEEDTTGHIILCEVKTIETI